MKRYLALISIVFMLTAWSTGCASPQPPAPAPTPPVVSHGGPVVDYISLFDNLRAAGAIVEPAGEVSQPFFSVKGNAITVNGENVHVFEYADAATANTEAALVSPSGSPVGTSSPRWIATPHFYKAGRLIVLYVGDDTAVINVLEAVIGSQFAGG